jgi:hypothetical protein
MLEKIIKPKIKRVSKSKRTHVRRMKAEAHLAGTVYRPGIH